MSAKECNPDDIRDEMMRDGYGEDAFTQNCDSQLPENDSASGLALASGERSGPSSGHWLPSTEPIMYSQEPAPDRLNGLGSDIETATENHVPPDATLHDMQRSSGAVPIHRPEITLSPAPVPRNPEEPVLGKRKRTQALEKQETSPQSAERKSSYGVPRAQHLRVKSTQPGNRHSSHLPLQTHASRLQLRQVPLEQALSRRSTFSTTRTAGSSSSSRARPFWAALQPTRREQALPETQVPTDSRQAELSDESRTLGAESSIGDVETIDDPEHKSGMQAVQPTDGDSHVLNEQQQGRVDRLQNQAKTLKIFMEGLGKDMHTLKQDLDARHRIADQVEARSAEQMAAQDALLEKATHLKSEALQLARDATNDLAVLRARTKSLEEQLLDQSNVLSTEKSNRQHLQTQLDANVNHNVLPEIKSYARNILDKLHKIQADLDNGDRGNSNELLEKLLAASTGLNSQLATTVESVASIKAVLDSVSTSVAAHIPTHDLDSGIDVSLKKHFDDALEDLRASLSQQIKLAEQTIVDRETMAHLRQQLQATKDGATDLASNLDSRTRELAAVQAQHGALQTQLAAQQKSCENTHSEKLARVELELQEKARLLQTTNSDLAAMTGETESLRASVEALQKELADWTAHVCPDLDQQQYEDKLAVAVETARKETTKAANDLHIHTKMESENKLKQLSTRVEQLEAELVSVRSKATMPSLRESELQKLQELARNKEAEVQSLQNRTNELVTTNSHLEKTNASLNVQHEAQKQHLQETNETKQKLSQELESIKNQLEISKQGLHAAEHKLEQSQNDARRQLEDKEVTCQRRVETLQHRVEQMGAELSKHAEDRRKHQHELERVRADHLQEHKKEVTRLTNQVADSEREKARALAECRRLTDELSAIRGIPGAAQGVLETLGSTNSTVIVPCSQQPSGATGTNRSQSAAITGVQGDLATRSVVQSGQIPTLPAVVEELQDDVSGAMMQDAAMSQNSLGPVIEESQCWEDFINHQAKMSSPLVSRQNRELGARNGGKIEQPHEKRSVVPTAARSSVPQQDLPTFAGFNASQTLSQPIIAYEDHEDQHARTGTGVENDHDSNPVTRMPRPNSSAKRLKPNAGLQRAPNAMHTQGSGSRFFPHYVTPKPPHGSDTAMQGAVAGQSSSPDVITNQPVDTGLYLGSRHGQRGADTDASVRKAAPQIKHKSTKDLAVGYGWQNVAEGSGRAEAHSSQQFSQAAIGGRPRQTRGTKNMTKGQRMSARFARELK
ncbi:uncharacterized protein RHO25_001146 [Cercospora beticola]|uniref:Uncharacterized protein n=1 Tax=Cercospora beticola TaxID=122368 RepID=A0ABZ0NAM2_CERBT|nr:hypothetical protein RHO25_001146 [Cercospora beticola]